jgi:hypothetical protein
MACIYMGKKRLASRLAGIRHQLGTLLLHPFQDLIHLRISKIFNLSIDEAGIILLKHSQTNCNVYNVRRTTKKSCLHMLVRAVCVLHDSALQCRIIGTQFAHRFFIKYRKPAKHYEQPRRCWVKSKNDRITVGVWFSLKLMMDFTLTLLGNETKGELYTHIGMYRPRGFPSRMRLRPCSYATSIGSACH